MKELLTLFLAFISICSFSQRRIINLPDLPGYVTLKCDFHMHTVFSDGDVWPTVRVNEALRDGLDAISITDHIEYTPRKDYIPVDLDAAWKIARTYAEERNIILVHGIEITRKMPPGHINALFIKDGSLIAQDSVWDSFAEAIKQGAFLMWNHPGWRSQQPDGIPKMYEIHRNLIKNGWLHGIEYYNDNEFYPLVFKYAKDNNLALMGNSDVHDIISEVYKDETHRPMTLVLAKERTHDALKEALFAGRTLVYYKDFLAGKEELTKPFFYACVHIEKPYYQTEKNNILEITNNSDIPFYLINGTEGTPAAIKLAANSVTRVVLSNKTASPLKYDVRNVITGEKEVLRVELKY